MENYRLTLMTGDCIVEEYGYHGTLRLAIRASKILLKEDHWVAIDLEGEGEILAVVNAVEILEGKDEIKIWIGAMENYRLTLMTGDWSVREFVFLGSLESAIEKSKGLLEMDHWIAIDLASADKSELPLRVVNAVEVLSRVNEIEIWVETMG